MGSPMLAVCTVLSEILTFPVATMKPSTWQCILFVTLVFAFGTANAGSIAKREDNDPTLSWYVNNLINNIRKMPGYGQAIADYMDRLVSAITSFDSATNGALSRLVNGILPCEIGLNGPICTGLSDNGGFRNLLIQSLNDIPSSLLTQLAMGFMNFVVSFFHGPSMDAIN